MNRCPTCKRAHKRSNEANAFYWALLHEIADRVRPGGNAYSADQWHAYCKSRWLGCDDIKLPNGRVLTIPKSSAGLEADKFNAYVGKVEAWAAERDVFLADREAA